MEHAVVTLAIGHQSQRMLTLSGPFLKAYSKKIGADYIIINQHLIRGYAAHLEKFQLYNLLDKYKRIVYIDVDIIVQEHTPNIFDEVPYTHVGAIYDNGKNDINDRNRLQEIRNVQRSLGDVNWSNGYINSGVIVMSEIHKNIFKNPELRYEFESGFKDQTLINYNIRKNNFKIHKLDVKFNGMEINGFSSRKINPKTKKSGGNKTDAYCMHFANEGNKIIQMFETVKLLMLREPKLRNDVKNSIDQLAQFVVSQRNAIQKSEQHKRNIKDRNKLPAIKNKTKESLIKNPHEIQVFYDISELGWAQYLAAHIKYLTKNGKRTGIICHKSREVLYRDCVELMLPLPKLFIEKFGSFPSDGNHLFNHKTNERIKDHAILSRPFKRAYPKYSIITKYSKFEKERVFEPYVHSLKSEDFCRSKFGDKPVIIVFPRCRDSKFRCRNISRGSWINLIRRLCKTFKESLVVSIGSISGAYDININEKNYHNLVLHDDDETLDIMICLCNTNQAISAIGNQSGTVKITLLSGTPTYIFGDEKHRHSVEENWAKTDVKFWETKLTTEGYEVPSFQKMIDDITIFIEPYYKESTVGFTILRDSTELKKRTVHKTPPPTTKFTRGPGVSTSNIISK